jgi:hypothetical protein
MSHGPGRPDMDMETAETTALRNFGGIPRIAYIIQFRGQMGKGGHSTFSGPH